MSATDFAVFVDIDGAGSHPAAAHASALSPADLVSAGVLARSVRSAERAGFTAATFEDHPLPGALPRLDAVLRASFSAPLTSSIGLVPVIQSLYNEPFHVATQVASLDTASHGRAGWIVAGDPDPRIAARYGRAPLARDLVDAELADVVETARRLWDSWEDDAVIRDVATGRYLDRDKLHYADFRGERFSVKGPAILPRSPQGQSVVVGAAGSAAELDVALLHAPLAGVRTAAEHARDHHGAEVRVLLELEVVLDRAGQPAADRLAGLDAVAPWPDGDRARYVGDAAGLTELLVELGEVVDGVRILPAVIALDVDEIGRAVLPTLRSLGAFRSPSAGSHLRRSLGLPHPSNRFEGVAR